MRFWIIALLMCSLLLAGTSCRTKNVGDEGPIVGATFTQATTWNAGLAATLTVNWNGGTAPYTIQAAMGGGTTENIAAGTAATSPFTQDFTLVEGGPFTWTVTITDTTGLSGMATGEYTVGATLNQAPVIDDTDFTAGVLTVTVSDPDSDTPLTVTVSAVTGATVDATSVDATATGEAVFNWTADDPFTGVDGTTTVTVTDPGGATDTADVNIVIDPIEITLAEGALAAVPMAASAAVGDTVTVLVVSGDFPAAAAFNYLNGCAVTVNDGGEYVDGTFNIGSIGGAQKDIDGIWATMDPAPTTFFVPEDFMMKATDVMVDSSMDFFGFNATPIGAGEVTNGGDLINFGVEFDAAGTYTFGFIEFQDVKRTYYSDNAAVEYNWGDISNDYTDIPNSVVIE